MDVKNGFDMTDEEANEIRLVANQIMHRLWRANKSEQLVILERYASAAIKDITDKSSGSS